VIIAARVTTTQRRSTGGNVAVPSATDPVNETAERRARDGDWLEHAVKAILRCDDPDEVAIATVSAVADILRSPHARIYRIVGKEYRLAGNCVEGVTRVADGDAPPADAVAPPVIALRRYRSGAVSSTRGGDVVPICVDSEVLAVVHASHSRLQQLDADERAMLERVTTVAGAALRLTERVRSEHQRASRLEDLERAKSQFLNLASHELRGPMTVLMGYLSLLEDGAFGDVPAAFMRTLPVLNARLAEMEGLINAMLETSRLEDDRLEMERAVIDVRELVDEALRRCEIFAHAGQLVSLRCGDRPAHVFVDRTRMTVAIANLIHNAIKYSVRHTDVHCVVTADSRFAHVAVTDQGVGIAPQELPKLFTRFGRIRNDPALANVPGTGLGLYLAREFARKHGGDITVESTQGSGSTFTLTLPLAS
jgi:signal transduction histidine kinase